MIMRIKEKYNKEVIGAMKEKFGYKSVMAVPKIEKVVVNSGFGRLIAGKTSSEQKKILENISNDLASICGQRPAFKKAKKSVATFKTKQGMFVGIAVTLRGQKMFDFLDRLIHITFPRTRDFRGIDLKSFDQKGNLTIPIREHTVFPEISPEKSKINFGFEVTVTNTAKSREEGIELLRLLGFPLKKRKYYGNESTN